MQKSIISLLILSSWIWLFADEKSTIEILKEAKNLYRKEKFRSCITLLEEALQKTPKDTPLTVLKARCHLKEQQLLSAATTLSPLSEGEITPELSLVRGELYFRLGFYPEALQHLRETTLPEGYSLLGQTYLAQGKHTLALKYLELASEKVLERTSELKLALAWSYLCLNRTREINSLLIGLWAKEKEDKIKLAALYLALKKKKKVIQTFPYKKWSDNARKLYLEAYTKIYKSKEREALKLLQSETELQFDQRDPFQLLEAKAYTRLQEYYRAKHAIEKGSNTFKKTYLYYQLRAENAQKEGDFIAAFEFLEQAIEFTDNPKEKLKATYQQIFCIQRLDLTPEIKKIAEQRFQYFFQYVPDSQEILFINSQWEYKNHHYKKALASLEKASKCSQKENPTFLYHIGKISYEINDFEQAESCFLKIINIRPQSYLGYFLLGQIYTENKQFEKAEKLFEKALQYKPTLAKIHKAMAILYYKKGDIFKAKSVLEILSLQQGEAVDADILFYQAKIFQAMGSTPNAINIFFQILDSNPIDTKSLVGLAECLMRVGKFKDALNLFDKTLRLDPKLSNCYIQRGIAYSLLMKSQRLPLLIDGLKKSKEINPAFKNLLAEISVLLTDSSKAISNKEEQNQFHNFLKSIFSEENITINKLGYITLSLTPEFSLTSEKTKKLLKKVKLIYQKSALTDFNQGIILAPKESTSYTNRAGFYNGIGELDLAYQDLQKAITLNENSPMIYYNLACNYALRKKKEEALANLEKAIKLGFKQYLMLEKDDELTMIRKEKAFITILKSLKDEIDAINQKREQIKKPQLLFSLAKGAATVRNMEEALNYFRRAILDGYRDREKALEKLTPLEKESLFKAYCQFLRAIELLEENKKEASLKALTDAVALGLDLKTFLKVKELKVLAKESQFQALLKKIEKKNH